MILCMHTVRSAIRIPRSTILHITEEHGSDSVWASSSVPHGLVAGDGAAAGAEQLSWLSTHLITSTALAASVELEVLAASVELEVLAASVESAGSEASAVSAELAASAVSDARVVSAALVV